MLLMCSCDQHLVFATFLWEKLSQLQFYKNLIRKTAFFEGWSWFKFNNLELTLGTDSKFYTSVAKGLKLKARKFWRLIPSFVEIKGGKLVGGFLPPTPTPILNRVKQITFFREISNWFWIALCHTFQLFSCSVFLFIYIYIYIYFIFNALLNVYQQSYVACNLFFWIFFIFYCVYHIHRKKIIYFLMLDQPKLLLQL